MIDDKIVNLLEQFSNVNKLHYNNVPLPYRPFGEVRGVIGDYDLKVFFYQSVSDLEISYDTIFSVSGYSFLPKGFCLERGIDPYCESKSFNDRFLIMSYDVETVRQYLDDKKKIIFEDTFSKIDKLENSLFKLRCLLRLSDDEIILSIGRVFTDLSEFTKVYKSVCDILTSLINRLDNGK
jgi:hypothetical protein